MITPKDIQSKQFSRGVRGYREDEVDTFLDMMTLEFEKLFKDNKKLSEEVTFLERELEKYRGAENEIAKTMQQAQQLMSDISTSAEKRAEIIVSNAELDAEATMHEARERVQRLEEENKNLHDRYISFRNRYKKMLEDELYRFESVQDDMFPDFTENKLEAILAGDLFSEPEGDTSGSSGRSTGRGTSVSGVPDRNISGTSEGLSSRKTAVIGTRINMKTSRFEDTDDGRGTVVMNMNDITEAKDAGEK